MTLIGYLVIRQQQSNRQIQQMVERLESNKQFQQQQTHLLLKELQNASMSSLQFLQTTLNQHSESAHSQLHTAMKHTSDVLMEQMRELTRTTDQRLQIITGAVEKRLEQGFEKTTATFTDVVKRLALIDEAQKRITELSSNVVNLQSVLTNRASRGAFGEVQLAALIRNMLPESQFQFQHTLQNGKRADCIVYLPEPTGNIVIDAKFPLENYRRWQDLPAHAPERAHVETQFKQDLRKHIDDIAQRYICPPETADGAVLFLPAEAIFSDIHAHFSEIPEYAQRKRVWIVSPTTMMAILTTARAVLKDAQTRKQVHIIQEHLSHLGKDFERFQARMDKLAKHIDQAHDDVSAVNTSAKKISSRFSKIEQVELEGIDSKILLQESVIVEDETHLEEIKDDE